MRFSSAFLGFILLTACSSAQQSAGQLPSVAYRNDTINQVPVLENVDPPAILQDTIGLPDTAFVNLAWFGDTFAFDLRYATEDNFTKQTVYPCAVCKIRYGVAKQLLEAAAILSPQGLKIKFFDCYRPVAVQRIFWEIFPDARYVANPNTSGSIHNRGAAVDITLVRADGTPLDMGTAFDHFGEEAHHDYTQLSAAVLANRKVLRSTMEAVGFNAIRTEWWHYNLGANKKYPLADVPLCEE